MVTVQAVGWVGTLTGTLLGSPQFVRLARTRNVEGVMATLALTAAIWHNTASTTSQ